MKKWFLLLLVSWLPLAQADLFEIDLLPPDEAFTIEVTEINADRIRASWKIADGYYMYRDKFSFASDAEGITLGKAEFPPGKIKQDEFFGQIETYRHEVAIEIPIIRSTNAPNEFGLKSTSQGCADVGVCYPPQKKTTSLKLAALTPAEKPGGALSALNTLISDFGFSDEDELLPADQAFQLEVTVLDANTLVAEWVVAEGYYLYREKFEFALNPLDLAKILPARIPDGEHKSDEFFGDIKVFHNYVRVEIPLQRTSTDASNVHLTVKYQGCAERGVCYPPMSKLLELALPVASSLTPPAATSTTPGGAEPENNAPHLSEQDEIAENLVKGNIWGTLIAFFGFGLLLAFTPCVFPMIPILSSIIVGQGEKITATRGFIMSLVYVLAMALTYTVAGVFAGVFGENLQAAFQNPWILSTFAGVFVLLSLSMFGFYDLQMPSFIQSRLTATSNRQKSGSLVGVAIMGFLSALIVGPCVAAPLAGALIYIGQTGDAVLGGMALFSLSMGMGAPLLVIGTGASKILPRVGDWMDCIKSVFGVMLLALAIWMLERILPGSITLLLWSVLLIMSSVYMGALDSLAIEASGWKKFWKGGGLVMLVYGVVMLIGATSGATDPLRPLHGVASSSAAQVAADAHMQFTRVKSIDELDRTLATAKAQNQAVMLDFYADWCVSCKEMEKYTFAKPAVQQALAGVLLLQADVTENNADDKALLKRYKLIGPPGIIFYDQNGTLRNELTVVGYKPADDFIQHLHGLK